MENETAHIGREGMTSAIANKVALLRIDGI